MISPFARVFANGEPPRWLQLASRPDTIRPSSQRESAPIRLPRQALLDSPDLIEKPSLRPARAGDIAGLIELENALFSTDRISPRSFRRLLGSTSAELVVAERAGELIGYAVALFRSNSHTARLYSIAVRPDAKGTGVALLSEVELRARRRGAGRLRLEVRRDNARAISLYERAGFVRTGQAESYYADGATAALYAKVLDDVGTAG